ncbi:unnamed protein product [Cylicocyclus nassatus]|uniref:Uncharacterized protein n=1 Tax=Cylicocyclus nassatus TaxID=53992 RepID=A0AA36H1E4_CYLNA|nr:unnamed protein product [Cylicocyclus nassatus]
MLERKTRQLRAVQQQCSALRPRRLHERSRGAHGTRNGFRNDRELLESHCLVHRLAWSFSNVDHVHGH